MRYAFSPSNAQFWMNFLKQNLHATQSLNQTDNIIATMNQLASWKNMHIPCMMKICGSMNSKWKWRMQGTKQFSGIGRSAG